MKVLCDRRIESRKSQACCRTTRLFAVALTSMFMLIGANAQKKVGPVIAQKPTTLSAKAIAANSLPSVVLVVCDDGASAERGNAVQGSGFFIDSGIVVTNYHVIKGMKRGVIQVAVGKERKIFRIARVLAYDTESDLAVLSVPSAKRSAIPSLKLADDALPEIGETIYALGNPEGLVGTISPGIVSAALRSKEKKARLQITAPISEGSSGGPVVNESGIVIGVVVSSLSEGQNLNFAVPVFLLRSAVNGLEYPTLSMNVSDELNEMISGNPRVWIWGSGLPSEAPTEAAKNDCPKIITRVFDSREESLKGLEGIEVLVEDIDSELGRILSKETIKARTEATLRRNGITVVDDSFSEPGSPYLYVHLNCIEARGYVCGLNVSLRQVMRSEVKTEYILFGTTTWTSGSTLTTGYSGAQSFIMEALDGHVIQFVNAYLKVNR